MRMNIKYFVGMGLSLVACVSILSMFLERQVVAKPRLTFNVGSSQYRAAFPLMPGDRLKLSFLEKLDLSANNGRGESGDAIILRSFYERADLSGEYDIATDGKIAHPVLGVLMAAGKPLAVFEKYLLKSYANKNKRSVTIRVTIVSRPPVYVRGLVGRPGAYRHVAGMTVSHAITLASGLYRGGDQRTLGDRISRETANLRRSQQMLARTLVQRSRLRAELEGNATFVAPIQLAKLVGAKLAKDLINAESAHLRKFAKMRTARTQNWARSSALALKKIANMRQQEKITRQQKLTVKKTINKYKARYQRTVVRASLRSQDMIVRLDLRQLELKSTESKIQAELLAAQQNTVKAERDYSSIILNETVKLKNRLERIENDIINFHSEISIARSLLGRIDKKDPRSSHSLFSEQILSYTLKRQGGVKNSSIKVNEDTRVRPGDILQVHVKK